MAPSMRGWGCTQRRSVSPLPPLRNRCRARGMLTLHKILVHRAVGYADYLASVQASGDYYVSDDGDPWAAPGDWRARSRRSSDWPSATSKWRRCSCSWRARSANRAARRAHVASIDEIAAHDLVFSAPSSVSAAWALADDILRDEIQRAQDDAVAEAFAYIERTFALVRRRDATPGARPSPH